MKRNAIVILLMLFTTQSGFAQLFSGCENVTAFNKNRTPDMGIVISSGDRETVWNALRLGVAAESKGDSVVVFVISKAVDVFMADTSKLMKNDVKFDIRQASIDLLSGGGDIYTCATCAKMRNTENVEMCTITSIFDLYEIVRKSRKVINF
jgi:peroxiredoxin family protein